ncbi:MAG: nuclear transport factor 2 family protein [Bdellovibrionales bacterium]
MAAAKKKSKPSSAARKALPRKTSSLVSKTSVKQVARPAFVVGEKLPARLQTLVDTQEIEQVLATFAHGLDRLEENTLRGAIHSDASFDLGPGLFQGTASDYIGWILGVLHGVKSSHHLLGQSRIEISGDAALVETYFHTHYRIEKPIGREDVFLGGRLLDRFERRPSGGAWKIAHRKQIQDWARTEAVSDIFYLQNPDALWSNRSKVDPSLQMAQFPGSQKDGKMPSFVGRRYESRSVKF